MSYNELTYYDKLPVEIQERMLLEQENQGNKRDPEIFRKNLRAGVSDGGFTWDETEDGFSFWEDIIAEWDLDVFFERYPKEEELLKKRFKELININIMSEMIKVKCINPTKHLKKGAIYFAKPIEVFQGNCLDRFNYGDRYLIKIHDHLILTVSPKRFELCKKK